MNSLPSSIHPQLIQAIQAAHQLANTAQYAQATSICDQILKIAPKQADAIHLLGVIAFKDGDFDKAIQLFKKAIKFNGNNPQFYSNLGLALHEAGQLTEAESNYRQALKIDPNHADAYYNLHAVLLKTNDRTKSIDCLRKVINLHPGDRDAKFMLAILLDNDESQDLLRAIPADDGLMQARIDAWEYFKTQDRMPVFTGSSLQSFEIGMNAAKVKGLVLEFGVRHGKSIRQLVRLARQETHGFDSFEGLPEAWHDESKGSYTTKGKIPKVPPLVKLHVGWFNETLPKFLEKHKEPVRFINVDCDIYSSTKTIFELLAHQIVVGNVIVFDEYVGNQRCREDEFKAFQEAVE